MGPSALNDKDGGSILSLKEAMLPKTQTGTVVLTVVAVLLVLKLLLFVPPFFKVSVDMILSKIIPSHLPLNQRKHYFKKYTVEFTTVLALIGLSVLGYTIHKYLELVLGYSSVSRKLSLLFL